MKILGYLRYESYENMGDRPGWKNPDQSVEVDWKVYHQRRVSEILVPGG
jgi:hypothetical protein